MSFEVSPNLSRDCVATLAAARRLWTEINRPNAMIKIPATTECLEAITMALDEGININITLMFSPRHVTQVFEACTQGLERRYARGFPLNRVRSMASLFVSRVDTLLDTQLPPDEVLLRGNIGIANARAAYSQWLNRFGGSTFAHLRAAGAHPPMCLWASTGVKNSEWSPTRYVEALIGPDTVNTVPDATLAAYAESGTSLRTLDTALSSANELLKRAASLGINLDDAGDQLQLDGLKQFELAFEKLLQTVA